MVVPAVHQQGGKCMLISRFMKDESGATAIEYALIAALIAVGIIAAATMFADSLPRPSNSEKPA